MPEDGRQSWQPAVTRDGLQRRADLLRHIRTFMEQKGILEVETPQLVQAPVTEVNIDSFAVCFDPPGSDTTRQMYLHTSPEYAMKRLLAAGSGAIYQICKVFRRNESGSLHNPEFTLLEWYRPGYDQHALMAEVDQLLQSLGWPPAEKTPYAAAFTRASGIDPHTASLSELQACAEKHGLRSIIDDRAALLDFIFSAAVMPGFDNKPQFIYDFPACQAALARIKGTAPALAQRFELFINGIEIANGFHELADAEEQRQRFEQDNRRRRAAGKPLMPIDEQFLAALAASLPDCAGVALGIDRLLMVKAQERHLGAVMAYLTGQA